MIIKVIYPLIIKFPNPITIFISYIHHIRYVPKKKTQQQEGKTWFILFLDEEQVEVLNFTEAITPMMKPYVNVIVERAANVKRIGVLISGSGSNLQVNVFCATT